MQITNSVSFFIFSLVEKLIKSGIKDAVYISGPMRGKALLNFPRFLEAEVVWSSKFPDIPVCNPAKNFSGNMLSGLSLEEEATNPTNLPLYMRLDCIQVALCTKILLLEDAEYSLGSVLEQLVAYFCGLRFYKLSKSNDIVEMSGHTVFVTALETFVKITKSGAKNHSDNWVDEPLSHHLVRAARHSVTAIDLQNSGGLYHGEDLKDHLDRAFTRATMALHVGNPTKNTL
jgi:hypothetical protein